MRESFTLKMIPWRMWCRATAQIFSMDRDYFYEELLGLRFKITPFSFFQTNSLGAEVLYRTVRGIYRRHQRTGGF